MKRSSTHIAYLVLGTCFLVLGALTVLNVVAAWRVGGVFLLSASTYAAMNFLIAYGLFMREQWLLYAFAFNLAGIVVMLSTSILLQGMQGINPLFYTLALGINALLVGFLYYTHARTHRSVEGNRAGVAFILLWVAMFGYTMVGSLS